MPAIAVQLISGCRSLCVGQATKVRNASATAVALALRKVGSGISRVVFMKPNILPAVDSRSVRVIGRGVHAQLTGSSALSRSGFSRYFRAGLIVPIGPKNMKYRKCPMVKGKWLLPRAMLRPSFPPPGVSRNIWKLAALVAAALH